MADLQIGAAVRKLRDSRRLTQKQVAQRAGFTRPYVSRVEIGDVDPSLDTLDRFAQAMNVETWKLVRFICRERARAEGAAQ